MLLKYKLVHFLCIRKTKRVQTLFTRIIRTISCARRRVVAI